LTHREIESHLESLKQYVAFDTPQFGASNISIIKAWLRQTEETLSAEAIAKELPEVNGKIMSSLQKYMVGNGYLLLGNTLKLSSIGWSSDSD
jgi:hypothetical protein